MPLLPVEHCQAQLFINMCKPEFQFYINLKYVLHSGMLSGPSIPSDADKQGILLLFLVIKYVQTINFCF
jgi:hypothetical protein